MHANSLAFIGRRFGTQHADRLRELDAVGDKAGVTAYLLTLVPPTVVPWRDTLDVYLRHIIDWLHHPPPEEPKRRRGNPSPLAARFLRFGAGRMVIDAARKQELTRGRDGKRISERAAARLVAQYIRDSPLVQSLTPDERQRLKIPEPTHLRRRIDIDPFADRLRKGDQD